MSSEDLARALNHYLHDPSLTLQQQIDRERELISLGLSRLGDTTSAMKTITGITIDKEEEAQIDRLLKGAK